MTSADDYAQEIETLVDEQLLELSGDAISLTARGMFYADSIAAVFAHRHVDEQWPPAAKCTNAVE